MPLSLYQVSVPVYARILSQLDATLDKALAHAEAHKIKPEVLVAARLFPDMWSLGEQVRAVCNHATRGVARSAGLAPPEMERRDATFAEMKERIAWALAFVNGIKADQLDSERAVTVPVGKEQRTFKAFHYVLFFSMPNFYFHAATAYDILRHNGVPLTKTDFMGN